jgi:hypothetical protein
MRGDNKMCIILNASNINGNWILNCSEYEGEFSNAKMLKIINNEKKSFETEDFLLDKTKPCFSTGGNPWIKLIKPIPMEFLKVGNDIFLN